MGTISQCASFLFLNGRFESSSFPAERFTANNKYEFALKNKVISTRDNDHISGTEPVEVNGNAFHIFNSQALRQKVSFGTSDSPTAIKTHKFSRQDNISCEFYFVKLGSKPQGLRHKVLSEVSDGFAATDKALSEAPTRSRHSTKPCPRSLTACQQPTGCYPRSRTSSQAINSTHPSPLMRSQQLRRGIMSVSTGSTNEAAQYSASSREFRS